MNTFLVMVITFLMLWCIWRGALKGFPLDEPGKRGSYAAISFLVGAMCLWGLCSFITELQDAFLALIAVTLAYMFTVSCYACSASTQFIAQILNKSLKDEKFREKLFRSID